MPTPVHERHTVPERPTVPEHHLDDTRGSVGAGPGAWGRAVRWLGRWFVAMGVELRSLGALARQGLARGRRPWLGIALAVGVVVVDVLLHQHSLSPALWRAGSVTAAQPLVIELERLPLSLFVPTPYLPVWGASAQLLVVVGVGELVMSRWCIVVAALVGHVGSTLAARLMIEVGPGSILGLPHSFVHSLDTGPSGASVAVGACLLVAVGKDRCATVLGLALLVAALVAPGIDGAEHLVALAFGLLVGGAYRALRPRAATPAGASGPPRRRGPPTGGS